MNKVKIGVIGCGAISGAYLGVCRKFDILETAACADLDIKRARSKASEFGVPKACSVKSLLADPEIKIVLNLTIPLAHAQVALAALKAGKCVHNEKPLAVTRKDGLALVETAKKKKLRVGCAPDTFLGAGIQTCIKLINDGWIGRPIGATAFMTCHGHESWHPDPEFYYKHGGGPMFDMGPYYLTALVAMLGPVSRVSGCAKKTFPTRTITSAKKFGKTIDVEVPTHVAGMLEFVNGSIGTILTSFDVWAAELPRIEIYGTEGSLSVPDPNGFGGTIRIKRAGAAEWTNVPHSHGYAENTRGIGVADMATAIRSGRPHRTSGDLGLHVLDIMLAIHESSERGQRIDLTTSCDRPAPLPMGLGEWTLDD
jgi:predicted dehydrogenase